MNRSYFYQFICNLLRNRVISKVIPLLPVIMICFQLSPALCADFTGNWSGTWSSYYGDTGSISGNMAQTGTSLTGTMSVFNTECGNFYNLSLTGSVLADVANFQCAATCLQDGSYNQLKYAHGMISGNTMTGDYTVYSNGYYYDSGTFSLTRPDTTPPMVTITATDNTATEAGPTTGTFTVSRTGSTAASLTVYYSGGGTATAGVDRLYLPGSLVIPAGSSSATILITPINDTLVEGDETVIVTLSSNPAYTVGSPNNATVTITDQPGHENWTDGWWNPSESGWGVNVIDQNDVLFIVLYLYGQDGKPVWYSVSAFPSGTNRSGYHIYQGDLYYTTGPWFGGPYNPQNLTYQKVGTLTFSPSTPDSAQLSYSVNGTNVSKQVERFIFNSGSKPSVVWTDGWWNPSESGWGVNVIDQNDVLFNVLYLYGQGGKPVWYSVSAFPSGTNRSGYHIYQGDLYYTTGPWFGGPYNPQNLTYQKVGTLTFSPSTPDDAQLSYSVNGINVSKQIERFIFH